MKVLIATGIFPPDIGGPATYTSLLVQELPKRGIVVDFVTYGPAGISRRIPKGLRHLVYFFALFKKGYNSDVIFAQDTVSAGFPAFLAAKILRKKFFIRVPGDYAWEQGVQRFGVQENIDDFQHRAYPGMVRWLRFIQKTVTQNADVVITPSHYFKKVVSNWVKNSDQITVIYNGIDFSQTLIRSDAGFQKTLVSVGRLVPWKGFLALVQMMKDLSDWKLVIVGEGPDELELKEKVRTLGLESSVMFTGALTPVQLQKVFSESSVFVLNSTFESFSFVLVEAMRAGLIPIVARVGNLEEIVVDQKSGVFVAPNDIHAIKSFLKRAESDPDWYYRLCAEAQERSHLFSLQRTLDELEKVLKTSLS